MSSPDRELVVYRYLKRLHTTTFGKSLDVINNTDAAIQWIAELWDDLEAADKAFTNELLGSEQSTNGSEPSEISLVLCSDCNHYTADMKNHKKPAIYANHKGNPPASGKSPCDKLIERTSTLG